MRFDLTYLRSGAEVLCVAATDDLKPRLRKPVLRHEDDADYQEMEVRGASHLWLTLPNGRITWELASGADPEVVQLLLPFLPVTWVVCWISKRHEQLTKLHLGDWDRAESLLQAST